MSTIFNYTTDEFGYWNFMPELAISDMLGSNVIKIQEQSDALNTFKMHEI